MRHSPSFLTIAIKANDLKLVTNLLMTESRGGTEWMLQKWGNFRIVSDALKGKVFGVSRNDGVWKLR